MEPEVGELLDQALVATRPRRRAPPRRPPRRPSARPRRGPSSSSRATYEPSGRSFARSATRRQSHGAKQESEPVWQTGPGRPDAQEDRVAVAVVAELDHGERVARGLALVPELLRASGSRTTPRPSRACGGAPPRPSRRASARGRRRRPGRSPRVRSGSAIPPPSARASARAAARAARGRSTRRAPPRRRPRTPRPGAARSPAPPEAITGHGHGARRPTAVSSRS